MALRITYVNEGGLGHGLGLQVDDIITSISGETILEPAAVSEILSKGKAVRFYLIRGVDELTIDVQRGPLGIGLELSALDINEFQKRQEAKKLEKRLSTILLTTGPLVPERATLKTIGTVNAQCIYGVNILSDLATGIREVVGGRAQSLQRKVAQAIQAVDADLRSECDLAGGNGVVAIGYSVSEIGDKGGYMLMIVAVGTAVVLADDASD